MSKYLKVSIIVPVYNGGNHFRNCVSSLLGINFPVEQLQVILINDGSQDDTSQWLFEQKLSPNFEIITHTDNRGRAAARNSGLKKAKGDIIIFLDADMVINSDFVTEHIKAISRPEVAAVSGLVIANPNERKTSLQNYLFKYRKRGAKQLGEKNPIPFKYLITNNMSVKRKVVEKCGIFDEIYIGYGGEDTDYAIRLWELYPNGLRFSSSAVSIDCQNETLYDLQVKMNKYGSTNYLRLLDRYPDYTKELAGDWIATIKGKVVFNPAINFLVKLIYFIIPVPYFVRYSIAYSLIMGARNPEEGIPKFQSKR